MSFYEEKSKMNTSVVDRPKWDIYFMSLCFVIAERSIDPSTKHGAVWVSSDKRILSTGYNGPIKNSYDKQVPLTRPEKYDFIIHAESNCLLSHYGSSQDIKGSTMYITGEPCSSCLQMMLQKGIKHIVYGNLNSKCIDDNEKEIKKIMLKNIIRGDKNICISRFGDTDMYQVSRVISKAAEKLSYD